MNIIFKKLFLLSFLLFVFTLSCSEEFVYSKYQKIGNSWDKNKEYNFSYQIKDSSIAYDFYLEIRNNDFYPYQNIWLFYSEKDSLDSSLSCDTIECILADNYGKWFGSGISIYHLNIPIRNGFRYSNTGEYTFTIRHGMRDSQLFGIEEIGLCIEKSKNSY